MRRSTQTRVAPSSKVMRRGKTQRDRQSGAWTNHRRNKELRRHDAKPTPSAWA